MNTIVHGIHYTPPVCACQAQFSNFSQPRRGFRRRPQNILKKLKKYIYKPFHMW
jgi:hypothetical protein